ncbi:MAG TPA: hypothetical protein VKC59_00830 [Candidatus Limnocylindrales bacterium]|nr:hypothetical protein [Candidatus Limnocylindrales bacterium]
MRVRSFELRLIGIALVASWTVSGGLILLAYRPGGPLDLIVGLTTAGPIVIALAGVVWPPVARGNQAFAAIVWLGIAGLLCLVPSIAGIVNQLTAFGSQTLLPSIEAVYPWLVALLATSLFSGFGIARRLQGGAALRPRRLLVGAAIALILTGVSGAAFGGAAVANEMALRDRPTAGSRFGPTSGPGQPPLCDARLATSVTARLTLELDANVDLRPVGSVDLAGVRVNHDFRWQAYVATSQELGLYGAALSGQQAWLRTPAVGWHLVPASEVNNDTLDEQAMAIALTGGYRATAEDRGVEVIEGARARRCRIAVDGPIFESAFPQARLLVGSADLHRWRGQLDYWVFLDGEVGQIVGSINGEATGVVPEAIQGTIEVRLTATERGRDLVVYPPVR